jgi:hypothetical protein
MFYYKTLHKEVKLSLGLINLLETKRFLHTI